jgi:hypothetical protein
LWFVDRRLPSKKWNGQPINKVILCLFRDLLSQLHKCIYSRICIEPFTGMNHFTWYLMEIFDELLAFGLFSFNNIEGGVAVKSFPVRV